MPAALAIVMPVLDEAASLAARLAALQPLRARGVRVIVVDGGSQDGTLAIAAPLADRVMRAPRGRAAQMNAGAAACAAEAAVAPITPRPTAIEGALTLGASGVGVRCGPVSDRGGDLLVASSMVVLFAVAHRPRPRLATCRKLTRL